MDVSFGARLRAHRERLQISLETISNDTKIKLSLLEALERDDVTYWPQGLFRRAYVRSYAHAIGLDPAAVVREFQQLYPDAAEIAEQEAAAAPPPKGIRRLVSRAKALLHANAGANHTEAGAGTAEVSPRLVVVAQKHVEPLRDPVADLCSRIAEVTTWREVAPLLREATTVLNAVGLMVWSWEPRVAALSPAWAHGYPETLLARMPRVRRDEDNAIAAAFRATEPCIVNSGASTTGAVCVPMMTATGCVGVVALELQHGAEHTEGARTIATTVAAQVATLLHTTPLAEAATA